MVVDVIIPTYKPDEKFLRLVDGLKKQTVKPNKIIVLNTEKSEWDRANMPSEMQDVEVIHITKQEFDHGNTRNLGANRSLADVFIMMTMDAVPADDRVIEELIKPFENENIAASYGRQMAYENSSITEKLTREFNYPDKTVIKTADDIEKLQIKAYFCSNVCCAYKKEIFEKLGGFVTRTIFNEDMLYAAKAINAGYSICYAAEAKVYHSHEYSGIQQFHRNFDNGVSHAEYPEVFENIRQEGEGMRMVKTVLGMLIKRGRIIQAIRYFWATGCKYIGFKLGCRYKSLPMWATLRFTSDKSYFQKK